MHNKMQKKVIIVSLATAFLVVGCNGGSNSSTPSASNAAVSNSPVAAQLVGQNRKLS